MQPGCTTVQAGDVLGIHYRSSSGTGVVPYESSNSGMCCNFQATDLSRILNSEHSDGNLYLGRVVTLSINSIRRIPALVAEVDVSPGRVYVNNTTTFP